VSLGSVASLVGTKNDEVALPSFQAVERAYITGFIEEPRRNQSHLG
jgi:hypothetical protein